MSYQDTERLGQRGYKVLFDDLTRTLFEIYLYQPLSEYFQISELRDNILNIKLSWVKAHV